jgi:tetratricopeptide (TPR) repeat protein
MYRKGLGVKQDYEKALEWFFKAAEQKEKRSINAIAWTYHLMGEYEKALPWAEQALAVNPAQAYVVDTVATVYEGLGRYDEALEQFEKCLRMYEEKGDENGKQRTADKIEALKEKMNRK